MPRSAPRTLAVTLIAVLPLACRTAPATSLSYAPVPRADCSHGRWTGTRTSAKDGDSEPITVHVRPVLGGAGRLRELEVDSGDSVYRGLSVDVRDPSTGAWTRAYVNDTRGRFATLRTSGDPESEEVVWRSEPGPGGTMSEVWSRRPTPDTWTVTVRRSTDGGTTWTPVFRDELTRTRPAR